MRAAPVQKKAALKLTNNMKNDNEAASAPQPQNTHETQPAPSDIFADLAKIRVDATMSDGPSVAKVLANVPVQKPDKAWFVRTHPRTMSTTIYDEDVPEIVPPDPEDINAANNTPTGNGFQAASTAPVQVALVPGKLPKDMQQWLADNRDTFAFYVLHAMLHDPLMRAAMLSVPVTDDDFEREEHSLIVAALTSAVKIMHVIGHQVPCPPTYEFLRTYLEVAAKTESSDDEIVAIAVKLVKELQDPSFCEQHYCIKPYFEAWYSSIRAKKVALVLRRDVIPDVRGSIAVLEDALASADKAVRGVEDDPYLKVINSTIEEQPSRSPTGIEGLDRCLNGGWGRGEAYLVFGGTSSGKSIIAGQCAWHEATLNDGYPLIVSTELQPSEYVARMVSCGCEIPIHLIQDCENLTQIRKATVSEPQRGHLEEAFQVLKDRVYIAKVHSDDGMDPRAILKREMLRYESIYGRRPTWVCLDWLGSVADVGSGSSRGSAERATAWEFAANGCVKFADETGIPTLVLAQAVNDAQTKGMLSINDIGISKGIGKNMTAVIGLTNSINRGGGSGSVYKQEQWLCVCKARKGEAASIPVQRDFLYQRFLARQEESAPDGSQESEADRPSKPGKKTKYEVEVTKAFEGKEVLTYTHLIDQLVKITKLAVPTLKQRISSYLELGLVEKDADGKYRIASRQ